MSPIIQPELADVKDLLRRAKQAKKRRAFLMPKEQDAVNLLWEAWQRLRELGWREARYCPKNGDPFLVIEAGSTGIFEASYDGKWPDGHYTAWDGGDSWPSEPILYRIAKPKRKRGGTR